MLQLKRSARFPVSNGLETEVRYAVMVLSGSICSNWYIFRLQVVAAAGAVNHDELVKTVEKSFQSLSTDPTTAGELVMQEPASFTGSEVSA